MLVLCFTLIWGLFSLALVSKVPAYELQELYAVEISCTTTIIHVRYAVILQSGTTILPTTTDIVNASDREHSETPGRSKMGMY